MSQVKNRRRGVLVTGASRGIGRALCEELLKRGFEVHGLVRKQDQAPPGVQAHVGDIRDRTTVKALMRELAPKIDCYIANAGVGAVLNPSKEDTADKAADIMDINGTATIYSVYALSYEWIQLGNSKGKKIGVVSSLAAGMSMPKNAVYSASKSAQLITCEGLDYDLARNGIGVSVIQPGFIETEMSADIKQRPFLISAADAARRICVGMERGQFRIAFPAGTDWLAWSYHITPRFLLRWAIRWLEKRGLV